MDLATVRNSNIVFVRWTDIKSEHGWGEKLATASIPCVTIGILVSDTDKGVVILSDYIDEAGFDCWYGCSTFIPRQNITEIFNIGYGPCHGLAQ